VYFEYSWKFAGRPLDHVNTPLLSGGEAYSHYCWFSSSWLFIVIIAVYFRLSFYYTLLNSSPWGAHLAAI